MTINKFSGLLYDLRRLPQLYDERLKAESSKAERQLRTSADTLHAHGFSTDANRIMLVLPRQLENIRAETQAWYDGEVERIRKAIDEEAQRMIDSRSALEYQAMMNRVVVVPERTAIAMQQALANTRSLADVRHLHDVAAAGNDDPAQHWLEQNAAKHLGAIPGRNDDLNHVDSFMWQKFADGRMIERGGAPAREIDEQNNAILEAKAEAARYFTTLQKNTLYGMAQITHGISDGPMVLPNPADAPTARNQPAKEAA